MQRRETLQRANAVRAQRAQLKRDLKEGRCAVDVLLADPPACVQTAAVAALLLALPKYGPVKINKLLAECRIAPTKTVGGLTPRQREELRHALTPPNDHLEPSAPTNPDCGSDMRRGGRRRRAPFGVPLSDRLSGQTQSARMVDEQYAARDVPESARG